MHKPAQARALPRLADGAPAWRRERQWRRDYEASLYVGLDAIRLEWQWQQGYEGSFDARIGCASGGTVP